MQALAFMHARDIVHRDIKLEVSLCLCTLDASEQPSLVDHARLSFT
jgi:serine/threonine protein kinase